MVNAFTILSIMQLAIGLIMFVFGIVDRTAIQVQYSFLMLPIWIGILTGITGVCGILFGREQRIRGAANLSMVSSLRALNTMCVGLSFLSFYLYGTIQALIGWQNAYNAAIVNLPYNDPRRDKYTTINALQIPIDVATDTDTIQGVLAVIMVFCLAEMLIGSWIAMLDKSQMIFGSTPQRVARPLLSDDGNQRFYQQLAGQDGNQRFYQQSAQQPAVQGGNQRFYQQSAQQPAVQGGSQRFNQQSAQQPAVQVVPQLQQQLQQQPKYMTQGSNVPGNQGYMPSNQPQQPQNAAPPTNYQIPEQRGGAPAVTKTEDHEVC